jgi:hypothetical protein
MKTIHQICSVRIPDHYSEKYVTYQWCEHWGIVKFGEQALCRKHLVQLLFSFLASIFGHSFHFPLGINENGKWA